MPDPASSPAMLALHRDLIEAAITAPSPDNNQPWLFQSRGERLAVFLDPSRSLPSDVASMFDMTAIGAAVENAVIAATQSGFRGNVHWLGISDVAQQPVVKIELQPGAEPDPLATAIPRRCTNRKPYDRAVLAADLREKLSTALVETFPEVQVDWLVSAEQKARLGAVIARLDALRFKTRPFHEELFQQLRFRPEEVEATRDGLDVRTLELPPGVAGMLKMLRSWKWMQWVHTLHLTPLLTQPSQAAVRNSGAIAVISVPRVSAKVFFNGGRAIQRLWLAATAQDLAMHPLGSLPIFLLTQSPPEPFRGTIEQARRDVAGLLPDLGQRVIQLAFRVGKSPPPTQRSIRRTAAAVQKVE